MNTGADYYSHIRVDVLAHVPDTVKNVLSVGCGKGQTEAQLVKRGVKVTGIELNPEAAKVAAEAGINVVCGDAKNSPLAPGGTLFDCLIYADVLEHMTDPESVLREHVQLLAPDGIVIVSIPNFRHYSVFWHLFVKGHIHYCDAGMFDRTHIRLTTRKLVEEWFNNVGLKTAEIDYRMRRRDRLICWLSLGTLFDFMAFQTIIVGRRK